jgi:hypothetical protein
MKLCTLLLLSLALIGCAPPYIAELNSSFALAQQMTKVATLGTYYTGSSTTSMKFLPARPTAATLDTLNIQSGFLVSRTPGVENLTFVSKNSDQNMQSSGGQVFPLAGADPNYPFYEYNVIATTTTANILVYHFDAASVGNNTYQLFTAGLPNGPFQSATGTNFFTSLFGSSSVYAGQVLPLPAAPYSQFNFLMTFGTLNQEGTGSFASPIFSTGTVTNSSVSSLPGAPGYRVLYYQNGQSGAASLSYASFYDSAGRWVCYQWNTSPTSMVQLPGIANRIDALLSTGDLISTDGGTLRVYDLNGVQMMSVSLGAMQFCYEAYVGTTAYLFFTVSMDLVRDAWAFQVYAVPTSSLRGLHG